MKCIQAHFNSVPKTTKYNKKQYYLYRAYTSNKDAFDIVNELRKEKKGNKYIVRPFRVNIDPTKRIKVYAVYFTKIIGVHNKWLVR